MGRPTPPFRIPRLSSPFEEMKTKYDVVVVGSGYGGGIAAARLSGGERTLCVLERGAELHPGEYPSSGGDALTAFQLHLGSKRIGSETALFDLHTSSDISVLAGCGLGGTSLINANVCIEASSKVFLDQVWPEEVRQDVGGRFAAGMERARTMLGARRYPDEFPRLRKYAVLEKQASALNAQAEPAPLTVNFSTGPNAAGIDQVECKLCGDCCSGCNWGAKNTVLMNYLPFARRRGAEIFTEVRVDRLERAGSEWLVWFHRVGSGEQLYGEPSHFVRADRVVLSAGTLGSTEILLRSEAELPMSDKLGHQFSGNGDTFSVAFNATDPVNAIGVGERRLADHDPVGPCITGIIDLRSDDRSGEGLEGDITIEEGSPPGAIAKPFPWIFSLLAFTGVRPPEPALDRGRRMLRSLVLGPYVGAAHHTQLHMVNCHDGAGGKLSLSDDAIKIEWPDVGKLEIFQTVDRLLRRASHAIGARHLRNPVWDKVYSRLPRKIWHFIIKRFRRPTGNMDLVTVHPLGGCPMGSGPDRGVVNHKHQVFTGDSDGSVYDTLFVLDGSVVPRSLGINPLLTISGLAERACHYLLDEFGESLEVPSEDLAALPPEADAPRTTGLRFTEQMKDYVDLCTPSHRAPDWDDRASFEHKDGEEQVPLSVTLNMEILDVDDFVEGDGHPLKVVGVANSPLFGGLAMVVRGSRTSILVPDPDRINTINMDYELEVVTRTGEKFHISGKKLVKGQSGGLLKLWKDTVLLYTRVLDESGRECGRGTIRVHFVDFFKQLATMKPTNTSTWVDGLSARVTFLSWFAGQIFKIWSCVFGGANTIDPSIPREVWQDKGDGRSAPLEGEVIGFHTEDGVALRLTRFKGGEKGPVILCHGLGVSSRIFSIDTIKTNLAQFLRDRGYDVWLLDYRASVYLPASFEQFSADDVARYDFPAAVKKVLNVVSEEKREPWDEKVQLVVHCYGATTFFMSVLGGYLDPRQVRSVAVSQVATHIVTSVDTQIKSGIYSTAVLGMLFRLRYLNAYTDSAASRLERLHNYALRFWPMRKKERCRSDVCHRITSLYSPLYEHERLNRATHDALHEMFGVTNLTALSHLARMSRAGVAVDLRGRNAYMNGPEGNVGVLDHVGSRLDFPILFVHGAENRCYLPVSTELTLRLLRQAEGPLPEGGSNYQREVIPGFGHIDCIFGEDAVTKVYPKIGAHLDAHP